ncbi:unnamed protein product [Thelazia callipaeda]|uniref:INCENP_ARK-bind domain-containing protein n=1 Tax=Thelazia callipaeda TaxID=103827 RepID=A0A0N5CL79_THECL|nr:unnamed protein product [Thelazia callipaeda]
MITPGIQDLSDSSAILEFEPKVSTHDSPKSLADQEVQRLASSSTSEASYQHFRRWSTRVHVGMFKSLPDRLSGIHWDEALTVSSSDTLFLENRLISFGSDLGFVRSFVSEPLLTKSGRDWIKNQSVKDSFAEWKARFPEFHRNILECCDRKSVASEESVLHERDYSMELNFFAERMSEHVAELVERDLARYFEADLNDKARCFMDISPDINVGLKSSAFTPSECCDDVKDMIVQSPTSNEEMYFMTKTHPSSRRSSWLSLFDTTSSRKSQDNGSRSRLSFIWPIGHQQDVSNLEISYENRNGFMNLVRRTSWTQSSSSDLEMKIPDEILSGLSIDERDHVEKVLDAANQRSRSSQLSSSVGRRQSIYKLPDMDNFELYEQTHIKGVIEKAERRAYPFVIKVENTDTFENDSQDVDNKYYKNVTETVSNEGDSVKSVNDEFAVLTGTPREHTLQTKQKFFKATTSSIGNNKEVTEKLMMQTVTKEATTSYPSKNDRCEDFSNEFSDAEMQPIRRVTETATLLKTDMQGMDWPHFKVHNSALHIERIDPSLKSEAGNRTAIEKESEMNQTSYTEECKKSELDGIYAEEKNDLRDRNMSNELGVSSFNKNNKRKINEKDSDENSSKVKGEFIENQSHSPKFDIVGKNQNVDSYEEISIKITNDEVMQQIGKMQEPLRKSEEQKTITAEISDIMDEELGCFKMINGSTEQLVMPKENDDDFLLQKLYTREKDDNDKCLTKEKFEHIAITSEEWEEKQNTSFLSGFQILNKEWKKTVDLIEKEVTDFRNIKEKSRMVNLFGSKVSKEKKIVEESLNKHILTKEELIHIQAVEQRAKQFEQFGIAQERTQIGIAHKELILGVNELTNEEATHNERGELKAEKDEFWHDTSSVFPLKYNSGDKDGEVLLKDENEFDDSINLRIEGNTADVVSITDEVNLYQNSKSANDKSKLQKRFGPNKRFLSAESDYEQMHSESRRLQISELTEEEITHICSVEALAALEDRVSKVTTTEFIENHHSVSSPVSFSDSSNIGHSETEEGLRLFKPILGAALPIPKQAEECTNTGGFLRNIAVYGNENLRAQVVQNLSLTNFSQDVSIENFNDERLKKDRAMDSVLCSPSTKEKYSDFNYRYHAVKKSDSDRFSGLTEAEIQHIRRVDHLFETENANDLSSMLILGESDSGVTNNVYFTTNVTRNITENVAKKQHPTIVKEKQEGFQFSNVQDKSRGGSYLSVDLKSSEINVEQKTNPVLSKMQVKDETPFELRLGKEFKKKWRIDLRNDHWMEKQRKPDDSVKSFEESYHELHISNWYQKNLKSLKRSLSIEDFSGFNFTAHNCKISQKLNLV